MQVRLVRRGGCTPAAVWLGAAGPGPLGRRSRGGNGWQAVHAARARAKLPTSPQGVCHHVAGVGAALWPLTVTTKPGYRAHWAGQGSRHAPCWPSQHHSRVSVFPLADNYQLRVTVAKTPCLHQNLKPIQRTWPAIRAGGSWAWACSGLGSRVCVSLAGTHAGRAPTRSGMQVDVCTKVCEYSGARGAPEGVQHVSRLQVGR